MTQGGAQPEARLKKTVALVGMMGAGKTAVGRALANALNVPFLDSDQEIERAANMTIAEIFARDGEPFFRARESEVIDRLMQGAPCILSTGGGAFMSEANRALMTRRGLSLWLNADLDLLWSRVRHKDTRPLLRGPDPFGTLKQIYETRTPIYAQADVAVQSESGLPIEAMAARVVAALQARPDVLEMTP